jgi:hypothetical protein
MKSINLSKAVFFKALTDTLKKRFVASIVLRYLFGLSLKPTLYSTVHNALGGFPIQSNKLCSRKRTAT